jgi:hypothetical protein
MSFKRGDQVIKDGRPYYADLPEDLETCCDCALTHRIRYRIEDEDGNQIKNARLLITVWRDEPGTVDRRGIPEGMQGRVGFFVDIDDVKKRKQLLRKVK